MSSPTAAANSNEARVLAYTEQGKTRFENGDYLGAIALYDQGIALARKDERAVPASTFSESLAHKSMALLKLDRKQEAVDTASDAVSVCESNPWASLSLALAWWSRPGAEIQWVPGMLKIALSQFPSTDQANRQLATELLAKAQQDFDAFFAHNRTICAQELEKERADNPDYDFQRGEELYGLAIAEGKSLRDETRWRHMEQSASEYANPKAMFALAKFYLDDQADVTQGMRWLQRACEAGVPDKPANAPLSARALPVASALFRMGQIHEQGMFGIPSNLEMAQDYFKRAARYDFPQALTEVGKQAIAKVDAEYGNLKEDSEGIVYLKKAAELGDTKAFQSLALAYTSMGRLQDAVHYCKLSRENGDNTLETFEMELQASILAGREDVLIKSFKALKMAAVPTGALFHRDDEGEDKVEEGLRLFPSEYLRRLLSVKVVLANESFGVWHGREAPHSFDKLSNETLARKVQAVAEAMRIEDAHTVSNPYFLRALRHEAEKRGIVNESLKKDVDLLRFHIPDAGETNILPKLALAEKAHKDYLEDNFFQIMLAGMLVFQSPKRDLKRSAALLEAVLARMANTPDSDPEKMEALLFAGSTYNSLRIYQEEEGVLSQTRKHQYVDKSISLLKRFLQNAESDLHRSVPAVHYRLGNIFLETSKIQARFHLEQAQKFDALLPPFLRTPPNTPERLLLEESTEWVRLPSTTARDPSAPAPLQTSRFRTAQQDSILLEDLREKHRAVFKTFDTQQKLFPGGGRKDMIAMPAPFESRKRSGDKEDEMRSIGLEQVLGPAKENVYWGTKVTCVVVAPPVKLNAVTVVVEDANRYPAIVAMYSLSPEQEKNLEVGALMTIINPYARSNAVGYMSIRVDKPKQTLRIHPDSEWLSLCWGCLQEFPPSALSMCAKCKAGKYCSKVCQKMDWSRYGHNFACRMGMIKEQ